MEEGERTGIRVDREEGGSLLRRFLFETAVGDWLLRALERLTGFALVELEVLEGWEFGLEKPTPARQR